MISCRSNSREADGSKHIGIGLYLIHFDLFSSRIATSQLTAAVAILKYSTASLLLRNPLVFYSYFLNNIKGEKARASGHSAVVASIDNSSALLQ
jgi:hypothetical protein